MLCLTYLQQLSGQKFYLSLLSVFGLEMSDDKHVDVCFYCWFLLIRKQILRIFFCGGIFFLWFNVWNWMNRNTRGVFFVNNFDSTKMVWLATCVRQRVKVSVFCVCKNWTSLLIQNKKMCHSSFFFKGHKSCWEVKMYFIFAAGLSWRLEGMFGYQALHLYPKKTSCYWKTTEKLMQIWQLRSWRTIVKSQITLRISVLLVVGSFRLFFCWFVSQWQNHRCVV